MEGETVKAVAENEVDSVKEVALSMAIEANDDVMSRSETIVEGEALVRAEVLNVDASDEHFALNTPIFLFKFEYSRLLLYILHTDFFCL